MGYLHIENLYRPSAQTILLFRECWALEKVHGTSAHIAWRDGKIHYFAGGTSFASFRVLFDEAQLLQAFHALGHKDVTLYGEAYGGKMQGMHATYGDSLRFIAFDCKVGDTWLSVPQMADIATKLGQEVVPYHRVSTDLQALDAERDRPSEVALRRGIVEPKHREGVILRPLVELTTNNGERVIAKHKGAAFSERVNIPRVSKVPLAVLTEAQAIADEWVTEMRLEHVLQKLPGCDSMSATPRVIEAMCEDVFREGSGEVVESSAARSTIGKATAKLFKKWLQTQLRTAIH
jgi:hypothetical protein